MTNKFLFVNKCQKFYILQKCLASQLHQKVRKIIKCLQKTFKKNFSLQKKLISN